MYIDENLLALSICRAVNLSLERGNSDAAPAIYQALGLIAGAPTFVGAMVGWNVTSQPLELAFYALAGGAILYVIGEVWQGMRRYGHRELGLYMLACGFVVGVVTDLVVAYGGG